MSWASNSEHASERKAQRSPQALLLQMVPARCLWAEHSHSAILPNVCAGSCTAASLHLHHSRDEDSQQVEGTNQELRTHTKHQFM